jgi:hypothetical protein
MIVVEFTVVTEIYYLKLHGERPERFKKCKHSASNIAVRGISKLHDVSSRPWHPVISPKFNYVELSVPEMLILRFGSSWFLGGRGGGQELKIQSAILSPGLN